LPLNDAAKARFNETAAQEFFFDTQGLPYGYHNFLFGWIDTPTQNWPPILPNQLIPIVFSLLEKIMPATVETFLDQALNKRMDTTGLNVTEIMVEASKKNMDL